MITTSILRQQVWMADYDEFDHIVKNSQGELGLSVQYENHSYVEERTKQCDVMFVYGTYAMEGETDSKFSLSDIWNLFQEPNNTSSSCRQMINCIRAWNHLQKTSDLPLSTETIKQTHKIMMNEEDILMGNIESHLYLHVIICLYRCNRK